MGWTGKLVTRVPRISATAALCVLMAACPLATADIAPDAAVLDAEEPCFLPPDLANALHFSEDILDIQVGGRIALDLAFHGRANERRDRLWVQDARLRLTGRAAKLEWFVSADLLGTHTPRNLYEAWAAWEFHPALRVAAGQMRVPLGSEFATREHDLPFAGYAFPAYLDGRYDLAVRIDGEILDDFLYYEITAAAGEGFGLQGRRRASPMVALRLVAHPLSPLVGEGSMLRGAYFGVAVARLNGFDDPLQLATPLDSVVFTTADLNGDGGRWLHIEAGCHWGPLRVSGETVQGVAEEVPLTGGLVDDLDQLTAYHVTLAWNLTGHEQVLRRGRWQRGARNERRALPPARRIPGRLEAAVRYSNADMDRALFDHGIAAYNPSTQEVRTFSAFLFWTPLEDRGCDALRLGAGLVRTIADHEMDVFGFTNRDTAFVFRLEVDF